MPRRGPHWRINRRSPSRSSRQRILLVCEGERTEPRYFEGLRNRLRLNTLSINGTAGVDPRKLVELATAESRREARYGDRFDSVYCVFDRDAHANFQEASSVALSRGFKLARSWPCFEFWLLLHFGYSRAPYLPKARLSSCDMCIRDLRKHLPNYSKGSRETFDVLWPLLDSAIANAKKAQADAEGTREENPSTEVHELVLSLQALAAGE